MMKRAKLNLIELPQIHAWLTMITTSFAYGESYGVKDHYGYDERDFDDFYTAEDYDNRQAMRDGWASVTWDGRWPPLTD